MFRREFAWLVILLMGLVPVSVLAADPVAEERLAWVEQAGALVEAADSGSAEARAFQREVRASREALRELVREASPEDRGQYQSMILMVALLDAAAACHRGGYIVCPPDLMRQMQAQMARLRAQLGASG
jgi:hypothetical protein